MMQKHMGATAESRFLTLEGDYWREKLPNSERVRLIFGRNRPSARVT
jgi:hypothetical protein